MVWMHRMRVLVTLSMSMFLIWGSAACGGEGEQQAAVTEVNFDAKDFPEPTKIDNKYHPLVPGTKYFFEGSKKGVPFRTETVISQETKVVNGVTTRVIHDSDFGLGQLVETTEDWFAQDKKGNLWYMGEYATQYDSGQVTGHEGSWEAGVDGAKAGIVMLADPRVGTPQYKQEFRKGITEDRGKVVSVTDNLCVPYKCFQGNVLVIDETSPVEPGVVERKYYAPGVGLLRWNIVKGESESGDLAKVLTF